MRESKIRPKMTAAATIMPMTTLERPELSLLVPFWLAALFAVVRGVVDVTVVVEGGIVVSKGGGLVTTWAVVRLDDVVDDVVDDVIVDVIVERVEVVDVEEGATIERVEVLVLVVATRLVVVEEVVGSGPKMADRKDSNGSTSSSSSLPPLCLFSTWTASLARAARASSIGGRKYIDGLHTERQESKSVNVSSSV